MTMAIVAAGCSQSLPDRAPVSGQVIYHGKPLLFGAVMFQPQRGWPARGVIEPDGVFHLSTYGDRDGAAIGFHRVRVSCYEKQRPGAVPNGGNAEKGLGASLIPLRYTDINSSGLTAEVRATNEPLVFELKD